MKPDPNHPATRPASEPLNIPKLHIPVGIALPALMCELDKQIDKVSHLMRQDMAEDRREVIAEEFTKRAMRIMDIITRGD